MLNVLTSAPRVSKPLTPSIHRLRRGLPGYLILFAPHAFAPQRQLQPRKSPSPLVFLHISTHFTATRGIPLSSSALKPGSFGCVSGLSPELKHPTFQAACARFTPNNSGQRLPSTYYRGCWHVVSRGFLLRYRHSKSSYSPTRSSLATELTIRKPSSLTRRCSVRLSPIAEDSLLLPPVGVWAVSQSQCGRSPSQVGYASSPW